MKVVYQITVEIDDEECPRKYMHEEVIQEALDQYIGAACNSVVYGFIRVLHSQKVSERE